MPELLAIQCHFSASTLSCVVPCPKASTRASRFCAIGLFCLAALRSSATAAGWFFGVPLPFFGIAIWVALRRSRRKSSRGGAPSPAVKAKEPAKVEEERDEDDEDEDEDEGDDEEEDDEEESSESESASESESEKKESGTGTGTGTEESKESDK